MTRSRKNPGASGIRSRDLPLEADALTTRPTRQETRGSNYALPGCCHLVGWLVAERPSNMLVYLRDGSAQTAVRAATLRQRLQIKLAITPSHSILTPGQPDPPLTLSRKAAGRLGTGLPILKSYLLLLILSIP